MDPLRTALQGESVSYLLRGQQMTTLCANHAIFPGSFDPLTYGHVDLVERALDIFDRITVAVLSNSSKESLFSVQEREELIRAEFEKYGDRVQVESFSGLLVEFAKRRNCKVILRGLRAISDFDYEAQMALMNRNLSPEIETFFLMTREKYSYISSSLVKQVAPYGGAVGQLVPPRVEKALRDRYTGNSGS